MEPVIAILLIVAALVVFVYGRTWKRKPPAPLLGVVTPPEEDADVAQRHP